MKIDSQRSRPALVIESWCTPACLVANFDWYRQPRRTEVLLKPQIRKMLSLSVEGCNRNNPCGELAACAAMQTITPMEHGISSGTSWRDGGRNMAHRALILSALTMLATATASLAQQQDLPV